MDLSSFLTQKTIKKINSWEEEFNIKSLCALHQKVGWEFLFLKGMIVMLLESNNNLNKYAFLITLIHEIAHASIWEKYGRRVKPHGNKWKEKYKKMMLPFLNPEFFPEDILRSLSNHMINPKASTIRDLELRYDFKEL